MIRDRGVAHRYANALFGAAVKTGEEQAVLADLQSLEELYQQDSALQNFLEAPDVLTEHKVEVLNRVLQGKVKELVVRFLLLMLAKKRVQHLPLVFQPYRLLVEDHLGLVRAVVQTAVPLDGDLADRLRERLQKLVDKKVTLELKVDPPILGGVIVTLGGRIIDASLRHRLALLREELRAVRVR